VRIIDQVAKALHAAHKVGLIHRDIKPSNILLDDDDFAYLIDFGIARAADETRLTKSGNTIGTFAYIAPERLDGTGKEDARVDIYSLACVLYECLTGEPPFTDDTMPRLIVAHLNSPPPRPSITRPDVPAQVDEVIATGMAKDPDQRYATTVELADAAHDAITNLILRPAQNQGTRAAFAASPAALTMPATEAAAPHQNLAATEQGPIGPPPAGAPTSPRKPWWPPRGRSGVIAAIIVAVVVLVSGVIIFLLQQPSRPPAPSAAPSTQAAPAPPPPRPPPKPVEAAALDGLLLSPDQIDAAMGATGMIVAKNEPSIIHNDTDTVPDQACLLMYGPVETGVYPNEKYIPVRGQYLHDPERTLVQGNASWPGSTIHGLEQNVVLFPSAQDADAFFTGSAPQWAACSNRQFHVTVPGETDQVWAVGPISNTNGTLSATMTVVNTPLTAVKKLGRSVSGR
jgi:serine/threonine kinase PknH